MISGLTKMHQMHTQIHRQPLRLCFAIFDGKFWVFLFRKRPIIFHRTWKQIANMVPQDWWPYPSNLQHGYPNWYILAGILVVALFQTTHALTIGLGLARKLVISYRFPDSFYQLPLRFNWDCPSCSGICSILSLVLVVIFIRGIWPITISESKYQHA